MRKRIPIESKDATHLEVAINYQLGGMNYFSYKTEARGYYASVSPITVSQNFVSYTGFSGVKHLLLEVKRQSKKSEAKALELLTPELEQRLIDIVMQGQQLKADRYQSERDLGICIPPRFEGLTTEQIKQLPVQVVLNGGSHVYEGLEQAKANHDLSKLCGAMADKVNGRDSLRFESNEVYRILST